MPKDITQLEFRIIPKEETAAVRMTGRAKAAIVDVLAQKFINPETGKLIEVGEAVEVGPWDSATEGETWLKYYLADAYKHPSLKWPLQKNGRTTKTPIVKVPKPRDGKHYIWIIRIY